MIVTAYVSDFQSLFLLVLIYTIIYSSQNCVKLPFLPYSTVDIKSEVFVSVGFMSFNSFPS